MTAASPSSPGKILTVKEFLSDGSLAIPYYQRPYKWTSKNVNQLFSDIQTHKDKSSYRLGTIVLHQDLKNGTKDIVDGQQRTITLLLIVKALLKSMEEKSNCDDIQQDLVKLNAIPLRFKFNNSISKVNIYRNYWNIYRMVKRSDFTEEHINFFLNKCEVVIFALNFISEAFQFFDSQNSRGRDLEPHDLLKAYHLREFSSNDEQSMVDPVAEWENSKTKDISDLFSEYLYPIRKWSKGNKVGYFRKEDVELFKGVNLDNTDYPYIVQSYIVHQFIERYNNRCEQKNGPSRLGFPFRLDQVIINGRRFFEMISYYQKMLDDYVKVPTENSFIIKDNMEDRSRKILDTICSYNARHRTGDRYVRKIFDCLVFCYIDKFGYSQISSAIEKIFIWAYSLRLKMFSVHRASMNNHVLEKNLFAELNDAIDPVDFFVNIDLSSLDQIKSKRTEDIEKLFRDMGYYEGE